MKAALSCLIVLLAGLLSIPVQAQEPFVLYDDFAGTSIDVNKWFGYEVRIGNPVILENVRMIKGRYLYMAAGAYGDQDSGSASGAATRLYFNEGDLVTAIKARVSVDQVSAEGCSTNLNVTQARVRLSGYFFNTTADPTPGSRFNDVYAYIYIERRSDSTENPNILHVRGWVTKCTDSDCTSSSPLFNQDLGTVRLGRFVEISIQWDQPNHRFIFQLDNNQPVYADYTDIVTDTSPPGSANDKRIEVFHNLPNCIPDAEPRPMGMMGVYFDKVYVNQSAVQ